jgi:YD repeat-containing protein
MPTKDRMTILALTAIVVVFGAAPDKPVCGACSSSVKVIEEQDGTGAVVREIVHAAGRPVWQVLADGSTQYFHEDPRGNVVMLSDATGACAVRYTYDPHGRPVAQDCAGADLVDSSSGNYVEAKQFANPLLFGGSWYDPETGERGATPETDFSGLYAGPGGRFYHADEGRPTTRSSSDAPVPYALPSAGSTVNATAGILQPDGGAAGAGGWYQGWIELNSVTQTVTRAIETGRSGTARARAGTVLEEIEVEKEVDRTSVPLVQACSGGRASRGWIEVNSVTQTVTRAIETGRSGTARARAGTVLEEIEVEKGGGSWYEGRIELNSVTQTVTRAIETGRSGTARARAGTVLEEIEVEKEVDRTSVPLVQACSGGTAYQGWIELNSVTQTVTRAIETGRSGTARARGGTDSGAALSGATPALGRCIYPFCPGYLAIP